MRAESQTRIKLDNQRAIVDYIIQNGPISRADLSKHLAISRPTASANVNELVDSGLLNEIGLSNTKVGKRPMIVDFNWDYSFVLILDLISYIAHGRILAAACNLHCQPFFMEAIVLPDHYTAGIFREYVPQMLHTLLERNRILPSKISRLVLTAPQPRRDDGYPRFTCPDGSAVDLEEIFSPDFSGRMLVKNDIHLAALGEKHFGAGKKDQNLLFVWLGLTVGSGLILNGKLSEDWNPSEIGSCLVFDENQQGHLPLRAVTSPEGIRSYIEAHRGEAVQSRISDYLLSGTYTFSMLVHAAQRGDPFCVGFAKHVGKAAAPLLANLASVLGLQAMILGGDYAAFGSPLFDEIKKRMTFLIPPVSLSPPKHGNAAMYGAFQVGVEDTIKHLI